MAVTREQYEAARRWLRWMATDKVGHPERCKPPVRVSLVTDEAVRLAQRTRHVLADDARSDVLVMDLPHGRRAVNRGLFLLIYNEDTAIQRWVAPKAQYPTSDDAMMLADAPHYGGPGRAFAHAATVRDAGGAWIVTQFSGLDV